MSEEKSYGRVAYEAFGGGPWINYPFRQEIEKASAAVIAEYERRNGALPNYYDPAKSYKDMARTIDDLRKQIDEMRKRIKTVPAIRYEDIANILFAQKSICNAIPCCDVYAAAKEIHALVYGDPQVGVDMAAPNQDLTVITNRKTNHHETIMRMQQTKHETHAFETKVNPEEKKAETEQQYQDRLLRALRDFG